ncbi:MAG: hypothetical protein KKC21_04680 [Nitrospinae bacterium]|nr:hypothetical protein [Nitrospinota bacterium]
MKKILIIIFALTTISACTRKEIYVGENWKYETAGYDVPDTYPAWISNPSLGGYIGGVGLGKSNVQGGADTQRDIAKTIARGKAIRKVHILVDTVCNNPGADKIEKEIIDNYKPQIDCGQAYMGAELIKKIVVKEEWEDPQEGDIYVWEVLQK